MSCVPCCIAGWALRHLPVVVVGLVLAGCELWLRTVSRSFLLLSCYLRVRGVLLVWLVLSGKFSQSGALVVLVEVLPGPACIAFVVLLAAVFSLMVCVLGSFGVVHSGEGSSQDRPLSLLVEVLPKSALCPFRATVVLPLWFEVCRLVGLRSGEVLPGWLLALLVEVLPKAALCLFWLSLLSLLVEMSLGLRVPVAWMVCFVYRALCALPDGGL
ncbi:hypothetical protein Taro_011009, partial [Colocasia esculenta]|nr:hypothetical protein [Colocasia esculenta]